MPLPLIALGIIWALPLVAGVVLLAAAARAIVTDRRGQGAPKWAPDPAFDSALAEDYEVAELDAIWALPTREPLR